MSKRTDDVYIKKILNVAQKRYNNAAKHKLTETEKLQMKYPHLFVLGCVMDSQIDYERAWNIPFIISDELGSKKFSSFLLKDEQWYIDKFKELKLHRFNETMARAFYGAIQKIHNLYNDDASNIWKNNPSSGELLCRFLDFDRVGIKIATMAANILSRDFGIQLKDKYAIDISPDIHVKRLMYRLGLIEEIDNVVFSKIDSSKITYSARSINPNFPGVLDLIFWEIGEQKICSNNKCHKKKCPFGSFCIRQGIK